MSRQLIAGQIYVLLDGKRFFLLRRVDFRFCVRPGDGRLVFLITDNIAVHQMDDPVGILCDVPVVGH